MAVESGGSRPNNDPYQSPSSWLAQVIDQASIISWNSHSSRSPPTDDGPVQPNVVGSSTSSTPAIVGQPVAAVGTFFSSIMTKNKNESVGGNNEHAIEQQQQKQTTRQQQQEQEQQQQQNTIDSELQQGPNSSCSVPAGDQEEQRFQVEIPSSATTDSNSNSSGSRNTERIEAILVGATSRRRCRPNNNKNKMTRFCPPGTFLLVVRSSTLIYRRSSSSQRHFFVIIEKGDPTLLGHDDISRRSTVSTMITESSDGPADTTMTVVSGSSIRNDDGDDCDDETSSPSSLQQEQEQNWSLWWSSLIKRRVHRPILWSLRGIARVSARYPIMTIFFVTLTSIVLLMVGLLTNFRVDLQPDLMWTPISSYPVQHQLYIDQTFTSPPRRMSIMFHAYGDNVLTRDMVRHAFPILATLQSHDSYAQMCAVVDPTALLPPCILYGIPRFWYNNVDVYDAAVTSDEILHQTIAGDTFADQLPVSHDDILGNIMTRNTTHIEFAESFTVIFQYPDSDLARAVEMEMIRTILQFNHNDDDDNDDDNGNHQQQQRGSLWRVEAVAQDSTTQELIRALHQDLPLVPIIFIVMSLYTAMVFARWHKIYSRSLLGFSAVIAVVLSLMSGFGLLFIIGVPFSTLSSFFCVVGCCGDSYTHRLLSYFS
jgi:Patched family